MKTTKQFKPLQSLKEKEKKKTKKPILAEPRRMFEEAQAMDDDEDGGGGKLPWSDEYIKLQPSDSKHPGDNDPAPV